MLKFFIVWRGPKHGFKVFGRIHDPVAPLGSAYGLAWLQKVGGELFGVQAGDGRVLPSVLTGHVRLLRLTASRGRPENTHTQTPVYMSNYTRTIRTDKFDV